MKYTIRRRGLAVGTALLALTICVGLTAHAEAGERPAETLHLLKPTGPHQVGTTSLYLKDESRPDPWAAGVDARELMVSLWYPTRSPHGRRVQYMTPAESEALLRDGEITHLPYDILTTTRTNAFVDAPPAGRPRSLPLIVLSPGFTKPRKTLSGLAEDLASHGYLVVAIDHTYENVATTFPDGRVAPCLACDRNWGDEFWAKLVAGRAADVSFVLDELTGRHPKWPGARLIDPSRIAMAGHSVGGASTVHAMVADPRIRAGINLDGAAKDPLTGSGLSRPFLFFGKESNYTPGSSPQADTWEWDWQRMTGWKRWLVVSGTVHPSFTDVGLLGEQAGIDFGADLPAARTSEITRRYVRAFFDLHLRHRPQPLLDQPSSRYPEVKFCSVETQSCA